jgi:class 3 adenylate cyclase/tetratricopeptide (TPR) repeat protein
VTAFVEWLEQVGLAQCAQALVANGIDFDVAMGLTEDDLRSIGLNLGDSRRLLQALAKRHHTVAAASTGAVAVVDPPIPNQTPLDERRLLSVMFCDIVGYVDLAQRVDPEELKRIIREFRRTCTHMVAQYDGYVAQYLGDGIMVYFGWPGAHEDDVERCVRSALDIVQAVKGVDVEGGLAVHVGIATGPVVVGRSEDGGDEDVLAVGETPNLAARLQGLAAVDQVVIGPTTRRLVGNAFEVTDLGVHPLKGIVQPVQAWRVVGLLRTEARFDAAHGGAALTELVGRAEEVALLKRRWQWARGGEGQVVLLSGEPGIGKSRLTQVLREHVEGEPHMPLRYQCSPFRLNSTLYPIIEHIELSAGFAREDTPEQKLDKLEATLVGSQSERAESAPLFAALLSLPTNRYPPLGLSPRRQKEKTFEVLIDQVDALSRIRPVLIIFEDAHWIDPTSQELLDALVPRLRGLRALMIITSRPQYTPRGCEYPHVTTMVLTGLPQRLSTELVGKVTQGRSLPPQVVDQIVAHADGIPLHIEELTKSVIESGFLHEEDDRYTLAEPLPALAIPTTLNASLNERLGRRAGVRELAQIGACVGREFSHELLATVSPYKGEEFEEELQRLIGTGLVFRRGTRPDVTYTFKHALVQAAAYDSLLKSKRQQHHAQIAQALETTFQDRVANEPELLAHHHTQAGHLTVAVSFWRTAGESALSRVALQEAVAHLRKGLAIVDRLPPSAERDSLELSLRNPLHTALLQWQAWASPEVSVNATAILRLARSQGDQRSLLIGLWGMWTSTITQGRVDETPAWAERLLDEGSTRGDIDMQILGHRSSMFSYFYLGELHKAKVHGNKALDLYEPSLAARGIELVGNDTRTAVGVCTTQAIWMLGYPDRAAQLCDQKDVDARRLGHPFDTGWALTWGAYVFDFRREPQQLLANANEAERLARQQSIPVLYNALVPVGQGLARLRMGHLAESIALLRSGIDAWNAVGGHLNVPYMKSALAEALALQGDIDAGLGLVEECLEQIERPGWGERVWLPEVLRLKGWMLLCQGECAEAEAQLRASIECARGQQAKSWELRSSTTLAKLFAAGGQRDNARGLLEPIYNWFTRVNEGLETHDLKAARALLDELR